MSNPSIPTGFTETWANPMQRAFQSGGFRLRGTTQRPQQVTGEKVHWRILGKGKANKTARGSKMKPMNADLNKVSKDIEVWDALEHLYYKDVPQLAAITPEMQDSIRANIMDAIGRQADDAHIAALAAETYTAAQKVDASGNKFDLDLARQVKTKLRKNTQNAGGRLFCAIPSNAFEQLNGYAQFTSSDYVKDMPFTRVEPQVRFWNSIYWISFPDDQLALDGANRVFYAWHENALGFGQWSGIISKTYDEDAYKRWGFTSEINAAVKVLQTDGVIEIKCLDDAPFS